MIIRADLHIHTVLSPCAEVEMIPPLIIERALEQHLDLIAITDHNASANVPAVIEAARDTGLKVWAGIEVQTREEVHVLCLFDTVRQVRALQADLELALPHLTNQPEKLGEQFIVDAHGDFVSREERLLLQSANITLEDLVRKVNDLHGTAIPAHIDRAENGLIPLLGFVPVGLDVPALEISPHISAREARTKFRVAERYAIIRGSDAHWLDAIGSAITEFDLEGTRSVANVVRALREGRYAIRDT
ncbi:MAG: PHP domain-containing protein [Anaerolineae bacterium]|nr:PHP domain-containing protein [Anaerolineae bacterium]